MKIVSNDDTEFEITDCAPQIARNLVKFGYPGVTADEVRDQLALPPSARDIIGMFAFGMIESNGLVPAEWGEG